MLVISCCFQKKTSEIQEEFWRSLINTSVKYRDYKVRQTGITNYDRFCIQSATKILKIGLQIAMGLQNATKILKIRLQTAVEIRKCDKFGSQIAKWYSTPSMTYFFQKKCLSKAV